jgi:predicted kinase
VHVSKDLWPNATGRQARQMREIRTALAAGRSVVVDNLNVTRVERASIIAAAHEYGAAVIGYFFDVTTRQAVARNAERGGKSRVPNVAIFTAAKRFERPELDEGFDQLFRVEITAERGYRVESVDATARVDDPGTTVR